MSLYLGDKLIAGAGTPTLDTRNIGQIIQSAIPLTDAGLHLLDGALINGSGSYSAFVTYIAGLVSDYPGLFETEANWQTSVTNYGVCGKFVYDSVNNTVRLPKLSSTGRYLIKSYSSGTSWYRIYSDGWCEQGNFFTGVTGTQTITLAKPFLDTNYSLSLTESYTGTLGDRRAINNANKTTSSFQIFTGSASAVGFYWDAKGYVDISTYKTSPLYQYIVIANSTKTEIEVDIDEIATDLNGKADVDLSNVSTTSGLRRLIEVYNNGTSWYKVFNEYNPSTGALIGKWCEQGGMTAYQSGVNVEIVTFLKPYRSVPYISTTSVSTGGFSDSVVSIYNLTTTGFEKRYVRNVGLGWSWNARGYIS